MSNIQHDEIERGLRELFDRQHHAIEPSPPDWDPVAVAVIDLDRPRAGTRRRGVAVIAATTVAATVAVGLGVVYEVGTGSRSRNAHPAAGGSGPGDSTPTTIGCAEGNPPATFACGQEVRWETPQVHLDGMGFSMMTTDATGAQDFVGNDPNMSIRSDPGDATYQTLELKWHEHGVPQRWYIYFHSDGEDWWAAQMRTLDGSADGDWVAFNGERFRTPLGSAWSGDLDVTATNHGVTSRLRMHITNLQAFLSHGEPVPEGAATTSAS